MALYETPEQAEHVFGTLFQILGEDETFTSRLRDTGLSAKLVHKKPECQVYISADEVVVGQDLPQDASITIKMSCDTAHALWMGTLLMPTAVATGRVRIRGKVAKVLEFVPILQPAFDRYPEIAATSGIAA